MRPLSVVIAIVVALALYGVVFERERLVSLAGGAPADVQAEDATPPVAADAAAAPERPHVLAMISTAQDVENVVSLRGETEASRRVTVQAETSGRIISEPLSKGRRVDAGNVLCQIDPGTRAAQLVEAEARLEEARISNTAAVRLAEGGFGSETRAAGANASLQAAQAAVDAARTEIDRLTIRAPFAGVLEDDTAELGTLMQPGEVCAELMQLDPIRIRAFLPETLVTDIAEGAQGVATLPNGGTLEATVTFVASTADPDTRTFRIDLTAANTDRSIRDGQSAGVRVQSRGIRAHLVPASALTLDDSGAMGLRIVEDGDVVGFRPVRLIRDTADGVLVTGLPETARIIVAGQEYVRPGIAVDVTLREPDA